MGEIYVVLGKRFHVERVNSDPEIDEDPDRLFYRLNGKIISLTENHPREEYSFVDGFMATSSPIDLARPTLCVKVLGVDSELGDRTFGEPLEALAGYAIANESFSGRATALPAMGKILSLRPNLVSDIQSQIGLTVSLEDLGLHLLYESC